MRLVLEIPDEVFLGKMKVTTEPADKATAPEPTEDTPKKRGRPRKTETKKEEPQERDLSRPVKIRLKDMQARLNQVLSEDRELARKAVRQILDCLGAKKVGEIDQERYSEFFDLTDEFLSDPQGFSIE